MDLINRKMKNHPPTPDVVIEIGQRRTEWIKSSCERNNCLVCKVPDCFSLSLTFISCRSPRPLICYTLFLIFCSLIISSPCTQFTTISFINCPSALYPALSPPRWVNSYNHPTICKFSQLNIYSHFPVPAPPSITSPLPYLLLRTLKVFLLCASCRCNRCLLLSEVRSSLPPSPPTSGTQGGVMGLDTPLPASPASGGRVRAGLGQNRVVLNEGEVLSRLKLGQSW